MDVPDLAWEELLVLASNRPRWRQRVRALREKRDPTITIKFNPSLPGASSYSTRSKATAVASTTVTPGAHTISPSKAMARKYRNRDAHEMLLRGGKVMYSKRKRKSQQKRTKLTTPQRAAAARAHYELHHGNHRHSSLEFIPPKILGHHNHLDTPSSTPTPDTTTQPGLNHSISLTPTVDELFKYLDDNTLHHDNLQNFSILPKSR